MTVIETIMRDVQSLSLREQVEVARYVQRLSESARRKRATVLRETHGSLDDADGRRNPGFMQQCRSCPA
jgi:hypothetical protein